jgi:hypothetical protein
MRQTIQFIVGVRRNGYFILGFSVISIVVSIVIFAFGSFQMDEINVEEEAIFTGRNGDVPVEVYGTYSVFVVSDYTCEEVEVSIYEEDDDMIWEYFFRDCDDIFDEDGWIYVGYFSSDFDGSMDVEANRQILIIDDMAYFNDGGGAMLLSLPFCCLGIIGLIIAVTALISAKEQVQSTETNSGIVFIEPSSPPEERAQDDVKEGSEWWDKGSKP